MTRDSIVIKTPWGQAFIEREPATHQGYLLITTFGGKQEEQLAPDLEASRALLRKKMHRMVDELMDVAPAPRRRAPLPEGREPVRIITDE